MEVLISAAKIINQNSPFHLQTKDILIKHGKIEKIGVQLDKIISPETRVISSKNLHVSGGWFDMKSNFCDPGGEQKEDIYSGIASAAKGGFTGVLLMPSTDPTVQDKSGVEYIINKGKGQIVDIYSAGALTANREGKELTEMYDMKMSGALAFTDDKRTVADAGLMLRALLYCKQVDALLISFAEDKNISGKSFVNESKNTTLLGLKGIPSIAEEIIISRDLQLLEYAGGKLHFSMVSTAGGVKLIREARKKGLGVTADVSAYHLSLDDTMLESYDANYKTKPPLRSVADKLELINGLIDGTIDAIVSDHTPDTEENKTVELDFAAFGMINLETAFSVACSALAGQLSLTQIIHHFTSGREILGLKPVIINENSPANLTLFNPDEEWTFNFNDIRSKSKNTPFIGKLFKGRVFGVINNDQYLPA